jgi:hypothetical protein
VEETNPSNIYILGYLPKMNIWMSLSKLNTCLPNFLFCIKVWVMGPHNTSKQ